jgi:hypothetical protein
VVDFFPPKIEDFSHRLADRSYNDAPDDPDGSDMELDPPLPAYEWMFYLIVEDCEKNSSGERVRMPLLVHGQDADYLLGFEATK